MAFTGKATYSAGEDRPEQYEDISDLIGINSPHDTPLLDALGDSNRVARSTVHEWLEEQLLPNIDAVSDNEISDPVIESSFRVANINRFRVGDQVAIEETGEVILVKAVDTAQATLSVERGYGGTAAVELTDGATLRILGNAALEGDDAGAARFTLRARRRNYTQIFAAAVEVSGSELSVRNVGVADELEHQKQLRAREMLRDLENCVINGRPNFNGPEGSMNLRRTMCGIISFLETHQFQAGVDGFPADPILTETGLNLALREIWRQSNSPVDLIVCGAAQKRAINGFIASNRRYSPESETYRDLVSVYESDFGVCRVLLSRWMPPGCVLLLDSTRIEVLPLIGRSFHYKPLASNGDAERGQIIGEYTLELRNENAHGIIRGLSA